MICAIMQPTYNPWLGYFDLIDKVDVFVFLDVVQLTKRSWQVRNRIKTPKGELLLSIPVKKTASRKDLLIKDTLINDDFPWREKHINSIRYNYSRAEHFDEVFPVIRDLILQNTNLLADFNIQIIKSIAERIGIRTEFIRASQLGKLTGKKDELLKNICLLINCDVYISPPGSAEYIESKAPGGEIAKASVELYYHNYKHPIYRQLYGDFIPYMGIFDLLLNEGFDNALNIIKSGRQQDIYYLDYRKRIGLEK